MPEIQPKVFISYSWTSQQHQDRVREWAERLISDNVQVVMDVFDLKEGDDKYTFMERMVTDESVTHVLMFCDTRYAEKADKKKTRPVSALNRRSSRANFTQMSRSPNSSRFFANSNQTRALAYPCF